MYESVLNRVLAAYSIVPVEIHCYQKGYRNEIWPVLTRDGRMINVTFYKREPGIVERINRADAVSEYLADAGMPTRRRIDSRVLQLKGRTLTYVAVYTYLPGLTIPWEAYTMRHIKLLGKTMSDMHVFLQDMPMDNLPSVYDEYLAIIDRMEHYFASDDVKRAVAGKLHVTLKVSFDDYRQLLHTCEALPQQPLHMDFVRGNILFEGENISGILDFEKTARGNTVVDIARTLAFLLVDCKYKTEDKVRKYFLQSGYAKRGARDDIGDDFTRERLVELFLLYDFYKFLRHNPYESLAANEHYTRTRDILVNRGVIL